MYKKKISDILRLNGLNHDPRHIEAYMRLKYRTLDGISAVDFDLEVMDSVLLINNDGREAAEELADSFGL